MENSRLLSYAVGIRIALLNMGMDPTGKQGSFTVFGWGGAVMIAYKECYSIGAFSAKM